MQEDEFIQAEGKLPQVNLPAKMRELMDHCWKVASVPKAAPQLAVQLGGGRAQQFQRAQASQHPADVIRVTRLQSNEHVKQVSPLTSGIGTYPQDWNLANHLQRVNAYTFRGEVDSRGPRQVEAAGGFAPPITRTDQYYVDEYIFPYYAGYLKRRFGIDLTKDDFNRIYARVGLTPDDREALKIFMSWSKLVDNESHHIGRMTASQVLKNYISTSRGVATAISFAGIGGWIYVTRVRGAFNLTKGHAYNTKEPERECAFPGTLPWSDVFAFRKSNGSRMVGPLWLRAGFQAANPTAYQKVFQAMSNRPLNL